MLLFNLAMQSFAAASCNSATFAHLGLFGAAIIDVTATPYTNLSIATIPANQYPENVTISFCEVTVQYSHPGTHDLVTVWTWLPDPSAWTGRFLGSGGGGWVTGLNATLAWPVSQGFAAVTTDGGHEPSMFASPDTWALSSPGNVNWALLQDFAAVALDDAATLGKAISTAYYGQPPHHAYWSGCSTGGRQGHMMAQRYPTQYNGILATASAFNWATFVPMEYWPILMMNSLSYYPPPCELDAMTQAAIDACDGLDGVTDRIIAYPGECTFDPHTLVGRSFYCRDNGKNLKFTSEAALIAAATWRGPTTTDGQFVWYGMNPDAKLDGLAATNCTDAAGPDTGQCRAVPFSIPVDWIRLFVVKDPAFNVSRMTHRQYDTIMRQSHSQYDSIIGTYDADLTDFRAAGGKLITWHGLADQLIPPNGTAEYFNRVRALDPHATDYYRYFEAPGVEHCFGGPGWYPGDALQSLIRWVEDDVVPDTLPARSIPELSNTSTPRDANLCLYPKRLTYVGGNVNVASSFDCQ